ncbi:succinylglutamate desuccinylase/aspartoacylase domain-containing protein [Microcoleus sp. FACHB-672]|uniref:M14 family zinc carboxypeptidase n=1 Tax=Microcoleus sp. FACHB-672 TaxID=2692825 RepID=UPI001688CF8F|nr:succinylglutamate desuccinylase/aspartoacylase family protein [Microcoleus sp. FACHB-672]MBD2041227.1 succinylglutamate desuccinylase/aspartoacylase family protein [Microcoleus sp. FACHB-672]
MIPDISTIPLLQLASGDRLSLQVYKFAGIQPGKKVYLQANLHGAEIVGNAVIHQLIEFLMTLDTSQLAGEIWLLPVCNPLGTSQRGHNFSTGRFNSYDGKDWNRIFWDYEKECEDLDVFAQSQLDFDPATIRQNYLKRIKESFEKLLEKIQSPASVPYHERYRYQLQSLCIDADYLIDLHSSTNQCVDFVYYFRHREESAKYFLLDCGIVLDKYDGDAFDEAFIKPWLALEESFSKLGRQIQFDIEAWTLELGSGMQMNPKSVEKGIRGIKNYLIQKGILYAGTFSHDENIAREMIFKQRSEIKKYFAAAGGMIQNRVALETTVKAGDWLYQILSFNKVGELPAVLDVCAEDAGIVFELSINESVNEGEFVLSMM